MNDGRLKSGNYLTDKQFDEQLDRIPKIRSNERKFYQKIKDIYATSVDYDKTAKSTKRFYVTVQNKMHYAVHGHTAAELMEDWEKCLNSFIEMFEYGVLTYAGKVSAEIAKLHV